MAKILKFDSQPEPEPIPEDDLNILQRFKDLSSDEMAFVLKLRERMLARAAYLRMADMSYAQWAERLPDEMRKTEWLIATGDLPIETKNIDTRVIIPHPILHLNKAE